MGTQQRQLQVRELDQADDGRWHINVSVFAGQNYAMSVRLTPAQAVRLAADLLAKWREHELLMKNPRT